MAAGDTGSGSDTRRALGAFVPAVSQATRLPRVQPRAVANGLANPFSWEGRVSPGDLSCLLPGLN